MPEWPSSGGSGGGSAIYKDGDPVSVQLGPDESTSVPNGETWVVTVACSNYGTGYSRAEVNGTEIASHDPGNSVSTGPVNVVLAAGDTITAYSDGAAGGAGIQGWSV